MNTGDFKEPLYLNLRKQTDVITDKSLSEALIFASTNPQYDDRLFIELQIQYMKIPSSNLGRICCVQKLFLTFRTIVVHNMFSPCSAKRRASDKDLPVQTTSSSFEFVCRDRTSYPMGTRYLPKYKAYLLNTNCTQILLCPIRIWQ